MVACKTKFHFAGLNSTAVCMWPVLDYSVFKKIAF